MSTTRGRVAASLTSLGIVALGWHQYAGAAPSTAATSTSTVTTTATKTATTTATATNTATKTSTSTSTATTSATTSATSTAAANGWKDGTYTGSTVQFRYGSISVTVTIKDGKITSVSENLTEDGSGRTQEIDSYAVPTLRSEVTQAQSANIAAVSGATFTSQAYTESLQSALDQA